MGRADGGILELRRLVDENPEWESDLWALYRFDVWEVFKGRVPVSTALLYIDRLPHDPNSMWRAKQLGGPEHIGWSHETYLLADQVDAAKVMIAIKTHKGKGRVKMPDPVHRPKIKKENLTDPEVTLENFDIHALMAQMQIG